MSYATYVNASMIPESQRQAIPNSARLAAPVFPPASLNPNPIGQRVPLVSRTSRTSYTRGNPPVTVSRIRHIKSESPKKKPQVFKACSIPGIQLFMPHNNLPEKLDTNSMKQLMYETSFTGREIRALYARFRMIAPNNKMTYELFRQGLGLFGVGHDGFLPKRLFRVFDHNCDEYLDYREYIRNLATMLTGTEDDKLELSFRMADTQGWGYINFPMFKELISGFQDGCSSGVLSGHRRVDDHTLYRIFLTLARTVVNNERVIDREGYKTGVVSNLELLSILGVAYPSSNRVTLGNVKPRESFVNRFYSSSRRRSLARRQGSLKSSSSSSSSSGSSNEIKQRLKRIGSRGTPVYFGHEDWDTVVAIMVGLGNLSRLTPSDFSEKKTIHFKEVQTHTLPSYLEKLHDDTVFVDFAPEAFQKIRNLAGISTAEYVQSVGSAQLLGNMLLGNLATLSQLISEGKSGALFFFSADGKYLLKELTRREKDLLLELLPGLLEHYSTERNCLITRFFGLHGLTRTIQSKRTAMQKIRKESFFVVMTNVFNPGVEILEQYDLKGSWVGRTAKDGDSQASMKDNDFIKYQKVNISHKNRDLLLKQIKRDTEFL